MFQFLCRFAYSRINVHFLQLPGGLADDSIWPRKAFQSGVVLLGSLKVLAGHLKTHYFQSILPPSAHPQCTLILFWDWCCIKGKIHYTIFPAASPSWWLPCRKSTTSPQHKQQVRYKLAKVRCVCCVVSFPEFYYNGLLQTCWPCR